MNIKILNSEQEFRKYIYNNLKSIIKIYVFEDIFDDVIYFYCFYNDLILATKECSIKKFSFYKEIYINISTKTNLNIIDKFDKNILKLIKKEEK